MTDQTRPAVSIDDIRAAATRIAPYAVRTPLVESPLLNDRLGFRLLVKAECLQHTGSFKLRGATNTVMSLPDSVTDVVAWSSGNHAQAVARAAALRGIRRRHRDAGGRAGDEDRGNEGLWRRGRHL